MQTLTKEQIEPVMGKTSFWLPDAKKQLVGLTPYLGGICEFDGLNDTDVINMQAKPNGLLIEAMHNFRYRRVALLSHEIISWAIEAQELIFAQKEKSVVGRALIGGLLLGPVGAIVGGMSGMGSKTVQTSTGPENILSITHADGVILFSLSNKKLPEVRQFFERNYPQQC